MKMLPLIILSALMATPALSMDYRAKNSSELLQRWMVLNGDCRGGAGDEAATTQACEERNLVDSSLFSRGYCYVGVGSTSRWEKGPASMWTRHGERAVCRR